VWRVGFESRNHFRIDELALAGRATHPIFQRSVLATRHQVKAPSQALSESNSETSHNGTYCGRAADTITISTVRCGESEKKAGGNELSNLIRQNGEGFRQPQQDERLATRVRAATVIAPRISSPQELEEELSDEERCIQNKAALRMTKTFRFQPPARTVWSRAGQPDTPAVPREEGKWQRLQAGHGSHFVDSTDQEGRERLRSPKSNAPSAACKPKQAPLT